MITFCGAPASDQADGSAAAVNLLDLGDAQVVPGDVEASFPTATAAVAAISKVGSKRRVASSLQR